MRSGHDLRQWLLMGVMAVCLAARAWAAPADMLAKATDLFQQGQYEDARKTLLEINRDQLTAEQKDKRDELLEEVGRAINQSTKARQDLADAEKALDGNNRSAAEKLFRAVESNNYASTAQKQRARQALTLINKQRELDKKVASAEPATKPAGADAQPTPPPAPAAEEAAPAEAAPIAEAAPATQPAEAVSPARTERNRSEANRLIEAGNEALGRGQYDIAEQRFQEALRLVQNHPAALQGLELVRQHRAVEAQPNLLSQAEQRRLARWERTERLYRENENEIRNLINNKRFDEARQRLAVTRQLLDSARADAPADRYSLLSNSLDTLGRYIEAEQRETAETQAGEQRRVAIQKERERRLLDMRERDERITQLMDQAMQLRKERRYEKAADVLREIITIDPSYERAQWMLDALEEAHLINRQKNAHQDQVQKFQRAMVEAEASRTPDLVGDRREVFTYPDEDEWRIIAQREAFAASMTGDTEEDRQIREKLKTVIPEVVFPEGTTLEEVIEFLRNVGRISIDANWNALQLAGIDKGADTLGLNLRNVRLDTALTLLLDNVGGAVGVELGYNVTDGVVRISTTEELNRKTVPRVYDVQDLLLDLRSYKAPDENTGGGTGGGMGGMSMGGGMGGGMGGMGGGMGGQQGQNQEEEGASPEEARKTRSKDLEDLIKKLIEPGTWEPEGTPGSLQVWNDRLLVRHTSTAHRQLVELFKQLRESKDMQVSIEARFITMTSNFLEEIGVDLDVVLNQGNAGLDSAVVNGSAIRDPVTRATLLQPRQFTSQGFTPAIPAFGSAVPQAVLDQPYSNVALVPPGQPGNYFSRHTTPIPLLNNSIDLAQPQATIVPGSTDLVSRANSSPGFQVFGSFLDNIQLDFLMRATQLDVHSSSCEAPRLVVYNNRRAYITVGSTQSYIFQPGFLPAGGSGVGGQAAYGQNPTIGVGFSGRTLEVTPTVSGDRKYVTLQLLPNVQVFSTTSTNSALGLVQLGRTDYTRIRTNAYVPDGGTVLLGGMKLSGETETEAGVPILSKVPVLKRAFTNRSRVKDEQVTLILVKPVIIIPAEQEENAFPDLISAGKTGGQ